MKKKVILSEKDKKDWINFTKEIENIKNKDIDLFKNTKILRKIPKLDLHGLSLQKANEEVNKFINKSFFSGYRKILIITGKGTRSKARNNPYISEELNMIRYSVPEYINSNESLYKKISKVTKADLKDGGEGAIYIFLKNTTKIKE